MISPPDRDDLRQEAAIAAWLAEGTYDGSCPLAAWKAKKALGARLDYARWWRQSRRPSGKFLELLPTFAIEDLPSFEPRLMRAMAMLPERSQDLIYLHYWLGYNGAEAAAAVGLRPSRSSQIFKKAHDKLRSLLCSSATLPSVFWRPPA